MEITEIGGKVVTLPSPYGEGAPSEYEVRSIGKPLEVRAGKHTALLMPGMEAKFKVKTFLWWRWWSPFK